MRPTVSWFPREGFLHHGLAGRDPSALRPSRPSAGSFSNISQERYSWTLLRTSLELIPRLTLTWCASRCERIRRIPFMLSARRLSKRWQRIYLVVKLIPNIGLRTQRGRNHIAASNQWQREHGFHAALLQRCLLSLFLTDPFAAATVSLWAPKNLLRTQWRFRFQNASHLPKRCGRALTQVCRTRMNALPLRRLSFATRNFGQAAWLVAHMKKSCNRRDTRSNATDLPSRCREWANQGSAILRTPRRNVRRPVSWWRRPGSLDDPGDSSTLENHRRRGTKLPYATLSIRNLLSRSFRPSAYSCFQTSQPTPWLLAVSYLRLNWIIEEYCGVN